MGCCGSTAMAPSEEPKPAAASRVTERTTPAPLPAPVSSRPSTRPSTPVQSSQPLARSRSRTASTASKPEWTTHHSGLSSQDLSTRARRKSAPQPPQSSSSQNIRPRTQSAAAPKRTNRLDSGPPMPGESDEFRATNTK